MKRTVLFIISTVLLFNCGTVDHEQEILAGLANMSSREILLNAAKLMKNEKYADARSYYRFIYENLPNSPDSVKAMTGLAYSLYHEGGIGNIVQS